MVLSIRRADFDTCENIGNIPAGRREIGFFGQEAY